MAKVRYILEVVRRGTTAVSDTANRTRIILPYVSGVNFSRHHAEVTSWTLGDHPVHHYAGVRNQDISFSGRSGVNTRFETQGVTSVASSDQSGPALFRKLEKFLEDFENHARDAMRQNETPPQLILRMLFEQKKLSVETKSFTWNRSSNTSRFSYEYQLMLESHGELAEDAPEGIGALLAAPRAVSKAVTKAINTISLSIAGASELLADAKTQLDEFREPLRALARMGRQARKFTQSADALVQWPKAFMLDFWFATFELTTAMFDSWAVLPFTDRQAVRSQMIDSMATMGEAKRATQAALGLNFVSLPGRVSTYESQIGLTDGTNDLSYTTRQRAIQQMEGIGGGYAVKGGKLATVYGFVAGDTLPSIAGKMLGDRSRWIEIADLNDMVGVDLFSNGAPLIGGTLLFVPAPEGAQLPGLSPDDLYGVDLQLGADGDFVARGSDPQDIAVIRGVDNLVQGLTNRFVTVQGANATFTTHGLPRLVGNPGTAERLSEAAIEADLQMRRDQRIADVEDLSILDEGDTLVVSSVLKPVIGKAFDVTVPFPA